MDLIALACVDCRVRIREQTMGSRSFAVWLDGRVAWPKDKALFRLFVGTGDIGRRVSKLTKTSFYV
jgi:hypothetical protein